MCSQNAYLSEKRLNIVIRELKSNVRLYFLFRDSIYKEGVLVNIDKVIYFYFSIYMLLNTAAKSIRIKNNEEPKTFNDVNYQGASVICP